MLFRSDKIDEIVRLVVFRDFAEIDEIVRNEIVIPDCRSWKRSWKSLAEEPDKPVDWPFPRPLKTADWLVRLGWPLQGPLFKNRLTGPVRLAFRPSFALSRTFLKKRLTGPSSKFGTFQDPFKTFPAGFVLGGREYFHPWRALYFSHEKLFSEIILQIIFVGLLGKGGWHFGNLL